jgi:hypothetical protein
MKNLESFKARSQESLAQLVDLGKQQPEPVQHWGVTVVAALGGAVVLAAVAKGVLGVVGTLAYPPVALTAGALSGGLFGWSFMQRRAQENSLSPIESMTEQAATLVEMRDVPPVATDAQL